MEATIMGYIGYRIWGIWGYSYNIPESKLVRGSRNGMEPDLTPTYIESQPNTGSQITRSLWGNSGGIILFRGICSIGTEFEVPKT